MIGAHNSALTWDKPANWADIYGAENDGVVPDKFRSCRLAYLQRY